MPTVIVFSAKSNMMNRANISVNYFIVRVTDKEKDFSDNVALRGQSWDGIGVWAQAFML